MGESVNFFDVATNSVIRITNNKDVAIFVESSDKKKFVNIVSPKWNDGKQYFYGTLAEAVDLQGYFNQRIYPNVTKDFAKYIAHSLDVFNCVIDLFKTLHIAKRQYDAFDGQYLASKVFLEDNTFKIDAFQTIAGLDETENLKIVTDNWKIVGQLFVHLWKPIHVELQRNTVHNIDAKIETTIRNIVDKMESHGTSPKPSVFNAAKKLLPSKP